MSLWARNGKIVVDSQNRPIECSACPQCQFLELTIRYSWAGTGMYDLDTGTTFLDTKVGWSCGDGDEYIEWVSGDDTSIDGEEEVNVKVDSARADGLWTSSVEIFLYAGWYEPAGGSGNATVFVTYNGITDSVTITPGTQSDCASSSVGTVTVYDNGTFDIS
jgi:hypothetical protein